jgi:Predicted membrane protein/domain
MTKTEIITSQYVRIDHTPAGIGERIFARMLDYLIMFLYYMGIFYIVGVTNITRVLDSDYTFLLIFLIILPVFFYSFLWEVFNRGRSLGKMVFGMRVVMRDGTTPTIGAYFMRWMLLLVDFWMSWIGIVIILLNKDNQRIGDLAAGTIVIKERDYHRIHVTLDEFYYMSRNYRPVFPQAENLSLEQINIINEALSRYDEKRLWRISNLAVKVREFLRVMPHVDDETFLRILTRDFQYYALEEI